MTAIESQFNFCFQFQFHSASLLPIIIMSFATSRDTKALFHVSTVTPVDFPALAEAEMLACSGSDGDPVPVALHFFRPDLVRAGIPPSRWPDFEPTIRRLAKVLKSDKFALYEVEKVESSSGGTVKKPIGMAWLTLPDDLVLAKKGKTKMDDIVARTQKIRQQLESVVWPESGIADGTNFAFLRQLKDGVSRGREGGTKKLGIGRSYVCSPKAHDEQNS